MNWKARHQDWYISEVSQLETNSIYNQRYRSFEKWLVSCGEIIIRKRSVKKYPILIVYPESTPYNPPQIYMLNELLTKIEVETISKNIKHLADILSYKKNILYHRHQMSNGSVCFIEYDNLYNDSAQIFTINDILIRVKQWLIGIENNEIPYDNIEVEFYQHFPIKNKEINVLLPEVFYNKTFVKGEFYLYKYPGVHGNKNNTYFGVQIIGENNEGVSLPPQHDHLFSNLTLQTPSEFVKIFVDESKMNEEREKGALIVGSWWDISVEPQPFKDSTELLKLLKGDNIDEALELIFKSKVFEYMKKYEENIFIGFRFLNRRKELEWVIIELNKIGSDPFLLFPDKSQVSLILSNYIVRAIRTHKFSDNVHHLRNYQRAKRDVLQTKQVSVIGCGALGSEIADCLGKAGIGTFTLVDNQLIEPNNSIRHLCGLNDLYVQKTVGVMLKLLEHNPFIKFNDISFNYIDVEQEDINIYIQNNGVGISTIADDNVESYLNEQAVINNKNVFYSRVMRGGKTARIFRVIPGLDACFRCLSEYRKDDDKLFPDIPIDDDFPTIINECNNPIRPASAIDIKLAASIAAGILLEYLQKDSKAYNHWIYSSEENGDIKLEDNHHMVVDRRYIPPHKNCPLCNITSKTEIRILIKEFEFMKKEVEKSGDIETGGILIGFKGKNNVVYICRATGPGPKAVRRDNWFERDVEYCQNILCEEYAKYGEKCLYVGEWHYHPTGSNRPSNRDLISLTEISESENYLVMEPVMIIFSRNMEVSCTVHPAGKRMYFTEHEIIDKGRNEI